MSSPIVLSGVPYSVTLESGPDGRLKSIRIDKSIEDYRNALPRITTEQGTPPLFDMRGGGHPTDLIAFLQHIESIGSLYLGIAKIYWEQAEFEWIADTPEEAKLIVIRTFSSNYSYPDSNLQITKVGLFHSVSRRASQREIVVPMSFFREGMVEFQATRHSVCLLQFLSLSGRSLCKRENQESPGPQRAPLFATTQLSGPASS